MTRSTASTMSSVFAVAARDEISKGQKNDDRDAEAIAEAVQRPTMKFGATKTADRFNLHRVRGGSIGIDLPVLVTHRRRCRLRNKSRAGFSGLSVRTPRVVGTQHIRFFSQRLTFST